MCKIISLVNSDLKGEICTMADLLYTLHEESKGFFKDRGSKFIAFAFPFKEQEVFDARLAELKKEYYDARHHCQAFRLGLEGETTYANDDGEPSHSAGTPILGAIQSHNLTNVGVIVIRYFGGTKLGIRGLIDAYKAAAEDAIENNLKLPIIPRTIFSLLFPYTKTSDLNRILHRYETDKVHSEYTDVCKIDLAINDTEFEQINEDLVKAGFDVNVLERGKTD